MVAVKQSNMGLVSKKPIRSLSIGYDGKGKVSSEQHEQVVKDEYQRGYEDASSQLNQQIVEFRTEVNDLREGTFSVLEEKFLSVLKEAREALMTLTFDCVKRSLGGFEMPAEAIKSVVEAMIEEAGLDDEKMDIRLNPADIDLLGELEQEIKDKHPALNFVSDASLQRGDCMLSSRFGKIDGLMSTKLDRLKESLNPSS
ncbi:MAG: FliH/SctL family protein [Verrucomicrobiota bacterium]